MSHPKPSAPAAFTPKERDYIRQELDRFFPTLPSVADGFQLRTWRGGPQAGQPKVPVKAKGLLVRGLMRLEATPWPPRLFFTEAGLVALWAMMVNTCFANPKTFAHVRQELGIDPDPGEPWRGSGLVGAEAAASELTARSHFACVPVVMAAALERPSLGLPPPASSKTW